MQKIFTGTGDFRIGLIGYALVSCEWEFFIDCEVRSGGK